MPATYKEILTIKDGRTSLSLKHREDLDYNCITWREKRKKSNRNRRLYYEQGGFWIISATKAFSMLEQAYLKGLFSPDYFRWQGKSVLIDSQNLQGDERQALFNETLEPSEDRIFLSCDDLRIIALVEPWEVEWRKTIIYSIKQDICTFRSFTRNNLTYENLYKNFIFANRWELDRAMLDADGAIFLEIYKLINQENKANQTLESTP